MTQADLNRAVAAQTGESVRRIARLGFSLLEPPDDEYEPEPVRSPQMVDWDALDTSRRAA
jgi:hypothetical protein